MLNELIPYYKKNRETKQIPKADITTEEGHDYSRWHR